MFEHIKGEDRRLTSCGTEYRLYVHGIYLVGHIFQIFVVMLKISDLF